MAPGIIQVFIRYLNLGSSSSSINFTKTAAWVVPDVGPLPAVSQMVVRAMADAVPAVVTA